MRFRATDADNDDLVYSLAAAVDTGDGVNDNERFSISAGGELSLDEASWTTRMAQVLANLTKATLTTLTTADVVEYTVAVIADGPIGCNGRRDCDRAVLKNVNEAACVYGIRRRLPLIQNAATVYISETNATITDVDLRAG